MRVLYDYDITPDGEIIGDDGEAHTLFHFDPDATEDLYD